MLYHAFMLRKFSLSLKKMILTGLILLQIVGTVISYEILLLQMRDFSHSDLPGNTS